LSGGAVLAVGTLVPPAVVLPIAAVLMLIVAAHLLALPAAQMPASRKRIRTTNGVVMLFTVPLVAYVFGLVTPANHTKFVLAWTAVAGLMLIIMVLAVLDVFNTVRINRQQKRELREQFQKLRGSAGKNG
jgi:hypothetical protein